MQVYKSVADPDLELRGWPGLDLHVLALLAFFPSVVSSYPNKGGGGGGSRASPLDLPL